MLPLKTIQEETEKETVIIETTSSDSESFGSKVERKIDEIGSMISSFVESKKLKMKKNNDPYDQDPPPFTFPTNSHYRYLTNCKKNFPTFKNMRKLNKYIVSESEAEYLFYLFRKCCKYPREHVPIEKFKIFCPGYKNEEIKFVFQLFQDRKLQKQGLPTISFRSFLKTLSVIHKGTNKQLARYITKIIFQFNGIPVPKKTEKSECFISKQKILWVYEQFSKIPLPVISPLPKLWKQRSDGELLLHDFNDNDCNTFSEGEEDEDLNAHVDFQSLEKEEDQLVFFVNNRILVYMNENKKDYGQHQEWICEFLNDILLDDSQIEYASVRFLFYFFFRFHWMRCIDFSFSCANLIFIFFFRKTGNLILS